MEQLKFENSKYFRKNIFILTILVISSLCFKLIYFSWGIPLTLDSLSYFFYAFDVKFLGTLPNNYTMANMGWSLVLSVIFNFFAFDNTYSYMEIQKLSSIVFSSLSVVPVFYLCRKFFQIKYSIIGALLIAFEPRILENSFLGTSDQLFLFLTSSAITLFLSKNNKIIAISFVLISFATIVRAEGVMIFFAFSAMYFIRFRNNKKIILLLINILLFFSILLPVIIHEHQINGTDMIFGRLERTVSYHATEHENQSSPSGISFIISGIENFPKYFAWILIPSFVIFFPLGIYYFLKKINLEKIMILGIGISISFTLFYIYAIHIPETRYFFSLYPLICLVSLFSIQKIDEKFKSSKILVIIICIIVISSVLYIEIKSKVQFQDEAYQISLFVNNNAKVINDFYPISIYLDPISIPSDYNTFKNTFFDKREEGITTREHIKNAIQIIPVEENSLEDFIKKHNKLTHIIVQEKDTHEFLLDVYHNESKFPYLKKIFDTNAENKNYKVKIFMIDYELFNKFIH